VSNWFAGLEDLALPRRAQRGLTTKSVATPATPATGSGAPQKSAIPEPPIAVATPSKPPATPATDPRGVATVATAAAPLATVDEAAKTAEIRPFAEAVAGVATVAGHSDQVHARAASDGVPADWVAGVASLPISNCPSSIPVDRWQKLMRTADRFIASPWAERLAALGWRTVDIFGTDAIAPVERHDHKGLIWFLPGHRLIAATAETATLDTPTGSRQTYSRHRNRITDMVLLWELAADATLHRGIFPTEPDGGSVA
jgi:hypothetical protein